MVKRPRNNSNSNNKNNRDNARCKRCVDRRVKCIGAAENCTSCADLGLPCPGYVRTFKFQDEAPALKQRYERSDSRSSAATTTRSSDSQAQELVLRPGRSNARYEPVALVMDEHVSPSLTFKAICAQQAQIFTNFVLSSMPCYFKCTETRVSVNWVEYVSGRPGFSGGSGNSPFDWAIRGVTTLYTGHLYRDERFLHAGRMICTRSLRGLIALLNEPTTATSDEALATAIVLAVYEKLACTSPHSWLRHASGIRTLMRLRGAQAHLHGFGRAMYIVYRNFLVTAALIEGEACFLEEPAWQDLLEQIMSDNAKQPDSTVVTDIAERAFREIVKTPGYVKRVREVGALAQKCRKKASPAAAAAAAAARRRAELLSEILASRAALRGIHTELGVAASTARAGHHHAEAFIGPIPHRFFDGYFKHCSKGIRSALTLLNYLILLLDPRERNAVSAENKLLAVDDDPDPDPASESETHGRLRDSETNDKQLRLLQRTGGASSLPTPPKSPCAAAPTLTIESLITSETKQPPTTDWLDGIVTTMGMTGVRISMVESL